MLFPWFHNRRKEIEQEPFPDEWRGYLTANVGHYALLTAEEKALLEVDLRIFREQKDWEGGGGFEVGEEIKVTVSAEACLLTLGMEDHGCYPNVRNIIVYPSGYKAQTHGSVLGGVQEAAVQARLGEAWGSEGPIILSWDDAVRGGENVADGHNVILHEFAHKLDFRSGGGDGVPKLRTQAEYDRWAEVMSAEYADLVEASEHGRHTLLDPYGATNPAEFFAVATEAFFEKSVRMKQTHPALYGALLGFYGIDWAERISSE